MKKYKSISIIIPAYNESRRILKTIKTVDKYCSEKFIEYEIIIVDDCSADDTYDLVDVIADGVKIRLTKNSKNLGKGYSIILGTVLAKYNLCLFTDADLATPIKELDNLINNLEDVDMVIASRNMETSKRIIKQGSLRSLLGKIFPLLIRIILPLDYKDTQCGFKLYNANIIRNIMLKQHIFRFSFDVELLYLCKLYNVKVKEVPVKWIDQKYSTVRPFRDGIKMLIDVLRIRYLHRKVHI